MKTDSKCKELKYKIIETPKSKTQQQYSPWLHNDYKDASGELCCDDSLYEAEHSEPARCAICDEELSPCELDLWVNLCTQCAESMCD